MLRDVLREAGWHDAERGQQRAGGADSPDVRGGPPGVHWECKFVERLNAARALERAQADAGPGSVPVVAWKRSREPWVAVLPLDELLRVLRELHLLRMLR